MSDETTTAAPDRAAAAKLRAKLLGGMERADLFALALGKTDRTGRAWMREGMPVVRIDGTPYVQPAEALEWVKQRRLRQKQKQAMQQPRAPGRPRKQTANANAA